MLHLGNERAAAAARLRLVRGCIGCAVRPVGDDGDDGVDRRGASGRADGDGSSISGESKKQRWDKIAAAAEQKRDEIARQIEQSQVALLEQ